MGWSFLQAAFNRKCLDRFLRKELAQEWGTDTKFTTVGNHLWVLRPPLFGSKSWRIALYLLAGSRKTGEGWGFKSMSEDAGPFYYTCPPRLMKLAGGPEQEGLSPNAKQWRYSNEVHQHHKQVLKRLYASLRVGDEITGFDGKVFTVWKPSEKHHRKTSVIAAIVSMRDDEEAVKYSLPERHGQFAECKLIQRNGETIYVGVSSLPNSGAW